MSLTRWSLVSATTRYVLCGGAIYWTATKGFWGGFCDSQYLYCESRKYTVQQIRQLEWKYGIKILRDEEQIKRDLDRNARFYWNLGVHKTFYFLTNMKSIIREQYENISSGKFLEKDEEDEDELEADELDEDEEEEEEEEDNGKENGEKGDKNHGKKENNNDNTNNNNNVAEKAKKEVGKGGTKQNHQKNENNKTDASGASATAEPRETSQERDARLLKEKLNKEEIEAKIRHDPSGKKEKMIEKIKKIHGME